MLQSVLARQLRGASARAQPFAQRVAFSTRSARLAPDAAASSSSGGAKPKKRHRIRNLFLTSTVLVIGAYAGGVYYSMRNDEFYDKFTLYVPLAETITGIVDDWRFWLAVKAPDGDYRPTWGQEKHKPIKTVLVDGESKANPSRYDTTPAPAPAKDRVVDKLEHVGGKVGETVQSAVSRAETTTSKAADSVKATAHGVKPDLNKNQNKNKNQNQNQKLKKDTSQSLPAAAAPAAAPESHNVKLGSDSAKVQELPGNSVPRVGKDALVSADELDPLLRSIARQVNLAEKAQSLDLLGDSYFKDLRRAVTAASTSIKHERDVLKSEYEAKTKQQTSSAKQQADKEYLAAKLNLVDSYNRRLQLALDTVTQKAVAAANNKIAAQYNELQRVFEHEISDRVENERSGRLSQLSELTKDVSTLQEAMLSSGRILESEDGVVSFYLALGDLQRVLASGNTVPLKKYIDTLTKALPSDPLVAAVAASISPTVKQYGVLSHTQLAARFALIEPEIRKASLVQPEAGIAGHIGSLAASQLLVKKHGLPEGDDVESVVARTETYLQQGNILQAVVEANSLQGWPKKIAGDWLAEARRRTEVEFLLTVLSEEGRLWSISRTKK